MCPVTGRVKLENYCVSDLLLSDQHFWPRYGPDAAYGRAQRVAYFSDIYSKKRENPYFVSIYFSYFRYISMTSESTCRVQDLTPRLNRALIYLLEENQDTGNIERNLHIKVTLVFNYLTFAPDSIFYVF